MRLLAAALLAVGLLPAQGGHGYGRAAGGVVFANPSGYGNVAFPGTGRPSLPPTGFGRPISPHNNGFGVGGGGGYRGGVGSYYGGGYPVIVGGGYGGFYDQSAYPQQQQQPNITIINNPPAQVAPAVVINQNFAAPPELADPAPAETTHVFQPAPRPETATVSDTATPHYFLIAYKDHSVYSALTYWIEDKTMHYVTPQQTHNQASLDLIDLDFTKKLNQR